MKAPNIIWDLKSQCSLQVLSKLKKCNCITQCVCFLTTKTVEDSSLLCLKNILTSNGNMRTKAKRINKQIKSKTSLIKIFLRYKIQFLTKMNSKNKRSIKTRKTMKLKKNLKKSMKNLQYLKPKKNKLIIKHRSKANIKIKKPRNLLNTNTLQTWI